SLTVKISPHLGHLAFFPIDVSGARMLVPQAGHGKMSAIRHTPALPGSFCCPGRPGQGYGSLREVGYLTAANGRRPEQGPRHRRATVPKHEEPGSAAGSPAADPGSASHAEPGEDSGCRSARGTSPPRRLLFVLFG